MIINIFLFAYVSVINITFVKNEFSRNYYIFFCFIHKNVQKTTDTGPPIGHPSICFIKLNLHPPICWMYGKSIFKISCTYIFTRQNIMTKYVLFIINQKILLALSYDVESLFTGIPVKKQSSIFYTKLILINQLNHSPKSLFSKYH